MDLNVESNILEANEKIAELVRDVLGLKDGVYVKSAIIKGGVDECPEFDVKLIISDYV